MKITKILSVLVSAAMLNSAAGATAFAAKYENTSARTYNYVALGDSIAAGFGLAGENIAEDPALVITDELLADPVSGAYPAIFTEYLKELGEEREFDVKGTNLASTAYRAEDIEKTIKTPGYNGEFATTILDTYVAPGASGVLTPYHDIYNKYLSEADLVSIQLGGNDIIMSIIPQMVFNENPILQASGISLMLTLFGTDSKTAIGGGLQVIEANKDNITSDDFIEAASFMYNVSNKADELVDESAEHVKGVVEAVKELNGDADIALVGMFNPYRTEESSDDMEEDVFAVLGRIYAAAANAAAESEDEPVSYGNPVENLINCVEDKIYMLYMLTAEMLTYKDADELAEIINMVKEYDDINELRELAAVLSASEGDPAEEKLLEIMLKYDDISELKTALEIAKNYDDIAQLEQFIKITSMNRTASDAAVESAIVSELITPIAMQMAGKNVDPQIRRLNEQLKVVAEETGAIYVDVYDISTEDDFDPHPNANGHKEIAGILFDDLYQLICDSMPLPVEITEEDTVPSSEPVADIRPAGDVNNDGLIDTTDAVYVLAHILGVRPLTADEKKYADMDGNNFINLVDLLLIFNQSAM
ncbi:MAG: dockerin [Ruminococcus sp.]|nr:dockerin [Ruminococcus sp.]